MPRTAYLGPEGSFSEEAARQYAGPDADLVAFADIAGAIASVGLGLVDIAVVPIENAIEGSINATLDRLIHDNAAPQIIGELALPIRHQLIARPDVEVQDIERVISVPAAAAQCGTYLRNYLPQAPVLAALSTSAAVSSLVHATGLAAIGTERAARLYGMRILAKDIQDIPDNMTRFVALGHRATEPTGRDKTSICCLIGDDRPGSLVAILREFAERNINLTRIESRPTRGGLGKYFFLIDVEGHDRDPNIAAALEGVRGQSTETRVLGSYPVTEELHQ